MAKSKIHLEDVYRFCGNGEGIAGLPHEISGSEASERGLLPLLEDALRAGQYVRVQSTPPRTLPDKAGDLVPKSEERFGEGSDDEERGE